MIYRCGTSLKLSAYSAQLINKFRAVADRVVFLENGKIVEENDSETFFSHPESERAKDFLSKVMH